MNRKIEGNVLGKYALGIFVLLTALTLVITACSPATPMPEQPQPEQPEATPPPETEAEPQAETEIELVAESEQDNQPTASWNAVSEKNNWVLIGYGEVLNPTVVEPGTYVTINFSPDDNQVNGSGGCNNYSTTYTADDNNNLTINGPITSTMMACEIGMDQEALFLGALETVTGYTVSENGHLLLKYDSGTVYEEQLVFIPETPLMGTVWVLRAYGDPNNLTPTEAGVGTTVIFSIDGALSGFGGCNDFSAGYALEGNQISINLPDTNMMVCETGMDQEQAFLTLLENAQSYRLGIDALEISTADGAQIMRFTAQQDYPLENVRWLLASIDGQLLPEGVTVSALFTPADSLASQQEGNTVNGSAGCNTFFGPYTLTGDTLEAGPFGLTQMMCDQAIMDVEQAFLAGLEGAQSYQISANQLIINTASGSLLLYGDRMPLEGPQWLLTGKGDINNPQPPIEGALFTAVFARQYGMPSGVKSGATGCNDYTAAYYAGFDQIKVNLPQTSQNTCSDAQTEAEQGYFLSLNSGSDYRILGNELYVYYDNNAVLIFVGSYPTAEEGPLTALDGTQWQLTASDTFSPLPDSDITLFFEINPDGQTGTINGSSGCNVYTAEIIDVFTLGPINAQAAICDSPEGIMEQESTYLNTLQNANGILLEGETLQITTDEGGLYFSKSDPVSIQPLPLQAIIKGPTESRVNEPLAFDGTGSSSGVEITSYQWDFGDGLIAEGVTVEHAYGAPGFYDLVLNIEDADGQTSSASVQVSIHADLIGNVWLLEGTETTLIFVDGMLSGNAGCNDYNAGYTTTLSAGNTNDISVGAITSTAQTCEESVMDQERAYLASLQSANSYTINGNSLILTTAEGQLVFYAVPSN